MPNYRVFVFSKTGLGFPWPFAIKKQQALIDPLENLIGDRQPTAWGPTCGDADVARLHRSPGELGPVHTGLFSVIALCELARKSLQNTLGAEYRLRAFVPTGQDLPGW